MQYKILLFILSFVIAVDVQAQNQNKIDSLETLLKRAQEDTNKIEILNYLCHELHKIGEYSQALQYGKEALNLADILEHSSLAMQNSAIKRGAQKGAAKAYTNIGVIYDSQSDYVKALEYYFKSLKIQEALGSQKGIAYAYNNIGIIYNKQADNIKALDYFLKSLKIKEDLGDKKAISGSYRNLGAFYHLQSDYLKALTYYFKSLKVDEERGYKKGIADSYTNIGVIYHDQNDSFKALEYYFKALKIYELLNDKEQIADSYNNIGIIYDLQSDNSKALDFYFKSLVLKEELSDSQGMANTYINIGELFVKCFENDSSHTGLRLLSSGLYINHDALLDSALVLENKALNICRKLGYKRGMIYCLSAIGNIYFNQNKYKEAVRQFQEAYYLADSIMALKEQMESAKYISISYKKMKQYEKGLGWHETYSQLKDSVFNDEKNEELTKKAMNYEFEKKETIAKAEQEKKNVIALKELQKQKLVRNGFVGGFTVVLLFAGVFFTQRNKISKEKKRSDELLLNILPAEVAEELKNKGSAEARQFDDVTVLFTDFKNFTQISENLSPSELVAEIHTCFKAFDTIMGIHKIEKIKTIGDSYMAAGGLPVANKTNATDVVTAALEIQQFMEEHTRNKNREGKEIFEIRIGIHTGPVVAGIVGIKKFAYDIWGDTVNIASRMETSGEAGKVNISGSTYELVKTQFNCIPRGKIQAKNKGEIDMYFVESINSA